MDAYGFDVIIVETVGVGQSEVDIVKTADIQWLLLFLVWAMTFRLLKQVYLRSVTFSRSIN